MALQFAQTSHPCMASASSLTELCGCMRNPLLISRDSSRAASIKPTGRRPTGFSFVSRMSPCSAVPHVWSGSSQAGCFEWRPLGRSWRALDDVRGIRCQGRRRTEHKPKLVDPVNCIHSSPTASAQSAARSHPSSSFLAVSSSRLGGVTAAYPRSAHSHNLARLQAGV